jgi:hypothetical protein
VKYRIYFYNVTFVPLAPSGGNIWLFSPLWGAGGALQGQIMLIDLLSLNLYGSSELAV